MADTAPRSIPLFLQSQKFLPQAGWPTHAAVALPEGFAKRGDAFGLFEAGQRIPAQVETVATWSKAGEPKWLHVFATFRYASSKPLAYELRKLPAGAKPLSSSLKVEKDPQSWTIDTGVIRFSVARPFAGLAAVAMSRSGAAVLDGIIGGPYLVDGKGLLQHSRYDADVDLTLEQSGPCQVTLCTKGWYRPEKPGSEPFAKFVTRITAFAGSGLLQIQHATILAASMKMRRIGNLGFTLPCKLKGPVTVGVDGTKHHFESPNEATYFHQESADRCRWFANDATAGAARRFDGWFSVGSPEGRVSLLVKDFWQKFPNEVEISPAGITYHIWPKHGRDTFTLEEQLDPKRINQFLCFHQGKHLDLNLPQAYFDKLKKSDEVAESRPEDAMQADAEGLAINTEFALQFSDELAAGDVPAWHNLYLTNPIALPLPGWTARSGLFGQIAAKGKDFPEVEEVIESGLLSYADPEKLQDYGKFNYGDTHHAVYVDEARASLHRNWFTNHYFTCSSSWVLVARGGSQRMLAWARRNTEHYVSIDQTRWSKAPGAFWHKGLLHWGGAPAGNIGHWPDPTGLLYAWLIDANRWAKDGYELWRDNARFPMTGVGREVNSTLVAAITALRFSYDEALVPAIRGMAESLCSVLPSQQHGSIWNPLWVSWAYDQMLEPKYAKFVIDAADDIGQQHEGIASLALGASAYALTHDSAYLTQHLPWLTRIVRSLYRQRDSRWNHWGLAPAPGNDRHLILQWPYFLAALRMAGIETLPSAKDMGFYPHGTSRHQVNNDIRGCSVLVLKPNDDALEFALRAAPVSQGNLQPALVTVVGPKGEILLMERFPGEHATRELTAYGDSVEVRNWKLKDASLAGLYDIRIAANQLGICQPLTRLPEAAVLKNVTLKHWKEPVTHAAKITAGYLLPLVREPVRLTFEAQGKSNHTRVRLVDATGKVLINSWLLKGETERVSAVLDPTTQAGKTWYLDVFSGGTGFYHLTVEGPSGVDAPLLLGRSLEDLQQIAAAIDKPLEFLLPPLSAQPAN